MFTKRPLSEPVVEALDQPVDYFAFSGCHRAAGITQHGGQRQVNPTHVKAVRIHDLDAWEKRAQGRPLFRSRCRW